MPHLKYLANAKQVNTLNIKTTDLANKSKVLKQTITIHDVNMSLKTFDLSKVFVFESDIN